jgi:hypothetical protein
MLLFIAGLTVTDAYHLRALRGFRSVVLVLPIFVVVDLDLQTFRIGIDLSIALNRCPSNWSLSDGSHSERIRTWYVNLCCVLCAIIHAS